MAEMEASRIRELLLDFYSANDPQRLNMGLDVFSMVVWTQQNGLASLNELLEEQYGTTIDPNKQLGGDKAAFSRFSTLMNTDTDDDSTKRNHIYDVLLEFYKFRDPSKIGRLNDFVQYIMLHGIDAFNRKLYAKYGEGISLDEEILAKGKNRIRSGESLGSSFTISTPQETGHTYPNSEAKAAEPAQESPKESKSKEKNKAQHKLRHRERRDSDGTKHGRRRAGTRRGQKDKRHRRDAKEIELDDIPPPPPLEERPVSIRPGSPPVTQRQPSTLSKKENLRTRLVRYYMTHDASKLNHVDSIVAWGMQIGEEELDSKLLQIYGSSLPPSESVEEVEQPKGGGVFAKKLAQFKQTASKSSAKGPPQKPKQPAALRNKPGLAAAATKKLNLAKSQGGLRNEDGPCSFYELDMTGVTFGVCKCGYSRAAHLKDSPENKRVTQRNMTVARALTHEMRASAFRPNRKASEYESANEEEEKGPSMLKRLSKRLLYK